MPEHAELEATTASPAAEAVRVPPASGARHVELEQRSAVATERHHAEQLNQRGTVVAQRRAAERLSASHDHSPPRPPAGFVAQLARREAALAGLQGGDPVQLAAWVPSPDGQVQSWDEVIEGVRWHANADGDKLWFTIENEAAVPPLSLAGFRALEGPGKAKPWAQWNGMHWQKWLGYVGGTIAATAAADAAAAVTKKDEIDLSKIPASFKRKATDPAVNPQVAAATYFQEFKIITRDEFDPKITEIARRIVELGSRTGYSCIISEGGKSNYWVTAKVLEQVHDLGGASPRRIISVPAKETGEQVQQFRIDLKGAGELVFLDDGAYSGAQLQKFISKVTGNAPNVDGQPPNEASITAHVGLVAMSAEARARITPMLGKGGILNQPIDIAKSAVAPADLNDLQDSLGLSVQRDPGLNPDGDYNTALYYKLPDYASVRHKFLLRHALANRQGTTSPSYSAAQAPLALPNGTVFQAGVAGTEPYKLITTTSGAVETPSPVAAGGRAASMGGQSSAMASTNSSSSTSSAPRNTSSSSSSAQRPFGSARPVVTGAGPMGGSRMMDVRGMPGRGSTLSSVRAQPFDSARPVGTGAGPVFNPMIDEVAPPRASGGSAKPMVSTSSPGANSAPSKTPPSKDPGDGGGAL